jgi:hypothetical protein
MVWIKFGRFMNKFSFKDYQFPHNIEGKVSKKQMRRA